MGKYVIESYGCQMNMAESNAIKRSLEDIGWSETETPEETDIVVINTCSVRKSAEDRIWGRLGFWDYIKHQKPLKLVVTGCMAQRMMDELKKEAPCVDFVVPVNDKSLIATIAETGDLKTHNEVYPFDKLSWQPGEISSYVPIMNGCDNFCSYCIVPYVRGREVSRSVEDILKEVDFLESKGVKEITLLGQNVNSYKGEDSEGRVYTFPMLLERIAHRCDSIRWIFFESPHPKDFSDDLIRVIRDEERVAKHLHIPLQSGSTRILDLMNRRYTREKFLSLIEKIRREIPSVTFAVDVMVAFPSETEEEFEETLDVVRQMRATEPFMYYYNKREGTRAVEMSGHLDRKTKGRRLSTLIEIEHKIMQEEKEKRLGMVEEALVTGVSKHDPGEMLAHTQHHQMVVVKTDSQKGDIIKVKLVKLRGNTFLGEEM